MNSKKSLISFFSILSSPLGIILVLFLGIGLILFSGFLFQEKKECFECLNHDLTNTFALIENSSCVRAKKATLEKTCSSYDQNFVHNEIASLSLCEREKQFLESLMTSSYTSSDLFQKHLSYLKKENAFSFKNTHFDKPYYHEIFDLAHPVQIESLDLQRLFSLIEGKENDPYENKRPPLLIQHWLLKMQNNHYYLEKLTLIQCGNIL
jgi:hypothetical protein